MSRICERVAWAGGMGRVGGMMGMSRRHELEAFTRWAGSMVLMCPVVVMGASELLGCKIDALLAV